MNSINPPNFASDTNSSLNYIACVRRLDQEWEPTHAFAMFALQGAQADTRKGMTPSNGAIRCIHSASMCHGPETLLPVLFSVALFF